MTFTNYLKQNQYSSKTISSNHNMILIYLSWLDAENIEAENASHTDLLAYIKHSQAKGLTQESIRQYINVIRLFYDYKKHTGHINHNPAKHIKIQGIHRRRLHHTFTPEELNKLYNNYPPQTTKPGNTQAAKRKQLALKRNKIILGLYLYQGIKTNELYHLDVQHIQLREGKIHLPPSKTTAERTLTLEAAQIMDLYDYIMHTRIDILKCSKENTTKLIIGLQAGRDITNHVSGLMKGLKQQHPKVENAQQLRASVITKWLKQYNLRQVQYMAGHRYISSTERYKANNIDNLKNEIEKHHPLG